MGHVEQRDTMLPVPGSGMSLRTLLADEIIPRLPAGWVATVFPGRVILYKEPKTYRYADEQITFPMP